MEVRTVCKSSSNLTKLIISNCSFTQTIQLFFFFQFSKFICLIRMILCSCIFVQKRFVQIKQRNKCICYLEELGHFWLLIFSRLHTSINANINKHVQSITFISFNIKHQYKQRHISSDSPFQFKFCLNCEYLEQSQQLF